MSKRIQGSIGILLILLTTPLLATSGDEKQLTAHYGTREDVQQFAWDFAQEHDMSYDLLMTLLAQAERKDSIIALMDRTPEGTWSWEKYRKNFLDKQRIEGGRAFAAKHSDTLTRAEIKYGVPAEVIVAIIGVETRYGRVTGNTRILDALATLAFDYPRRATFFRKELKHYLLLLHEENFHPTQLRGSYAGAMGLGQFMPSSYRAYAVDFDGDGVRDLLSNPVDAIGSVANYLSRHGWRQGLTVAIPAQLVRPLPDENTLRFNKRKPAYLLKELSRWLQPLHPTEENIWDEDEKLIPLRLTMEGDAPPQYWLGSKNLYVITRYNTSLLYAMAVHELSAQIRQPAK